MIVNFAAHLFLLILVWKSCDISEAVPPSNSPDLAGQFCEARTSQKCCRGRQDDCSAPILGTLCYCDDFCNRTRNEDCCPDFWTFCKGISIPDTIIAGCERNGHYYNNGETFKSNCNLCKCQNLNGKMEILCEDKLCLVDEEMIEHIRKHHRTYGWTAANYSEFWGRYYDDGLSYRLGTNHSKKKVEHMLPIQPVCDYSSLPREFDARMKWSGKISKPKDQGWCGASWAFSTVAVVSDRFAIALDRLAIASSQFDTKYENDMQYLSPQQLISCNNRNSGCNGGHLTRAWNFIRKFGLVPESCYPRNENDKMCRVKKHSSRKEASCPLEFFHGRDSKKAKLRRVGPAYRLSGEQDIMCEILESGPVQATIRITRDFFSYRGGIYKCSNFTKNERSGFHSIRIVGWGEEIQNNQLVKYWIVSNSWGEWWGEGGYFRIQRGFNQCQIEEFVLAAWANIVMPDEESSKLLAQNSDYNSQDWTNNV